MINWSEIFTNILEISKKVIICISYLLYSIISLNFAKYFLSLKKKNDIFISSSNFICFHHMQYRIERISKLPADFAKTLHNKMNFGTTCVHRNIFRRQISEPSKKRPWRLCNHHTTKQEQKHKKMFEKRGFNPSRNGDICKVTHDVHTKG